MIELGPNTWRTVVPFQASAINRSDSPVVIADLSIGCACTVVDRDKLIGMVVEPEHAILIDGEIDIQSRTGHQHVSLTMWTNDGVPGKLDLTYDSIPTYSLRPARLDFGEIPLSDTDDLVQAAIISSEYTIDRTALAGDVPWIGPTAGPRAGTETEIVIRLNRDRLAVGRQTGRVQIRLFGPSGEIENATLVVSADGRARVRAIPSHLVIRAGETREVRFLREDGTVDHPNPQFAHSDAGGVVLSVIDGALIVTAGSDHRHALTQFFRIPVIGGDVARLQVSCLPLEK